MTEFNPITRDYHQLRHALLNRREVALVDVREKVDYGGGHPLFAVNIAFSKLDIEILNRIPRLNTPVTLYDNDSGLARAAAALRRHKPGYQDIALLAGDLAGWRDAGGELFIDVNSPGKAFGELVESRAAPPSLSAEEVDALLHSGKLVAVLDARRFDEYQTMSIPGNTSVPGGEMALRVRGRFTGNHYYR